MKAFLALSWLAAIVDAATLNVGSGKTYTTVSAGAIEHIANDRADNG